MLLLESSDKLVSLFSSKTHIGKDRSVNIGYVTIFVRKSDHGLETLLLFLGQVHAFEETHLVKGNKIETFFAVSLLRGSREDILDGGPLVAVEALDVKEASISKNG